LHKISFHQAQENAERYQIIYSNKIEFTSFKKSLDSAVRSIPKRIASPYCKRQTDEKRTWDDVMLRDDFEEYLIPNEVTRYRISPAYLFGSEEVNIKFQGVGYGDFTVCMETKENRVLNRCQSVVDIDYVWFNITNPCSTSQQECSSIYFSLTADTTYLKCSEADCRFPDNVRILIKPKGLRCERNSGKRIFTSNLTMLISSYLIYYFLSSSTLL
jgi:hypothetical protein